MNGSTQSRKFRSPLTSRLLVIVTTYAVMTGGMMMAVSPERYNLDVGDIAPKTITATKDVVDEVTTSLRRERAAEGVPISYKEDENSIHYAMQRFDQIFSAFEAVRAYGDELRAAGIPQGELFTESVSREELDHAHELIPYLEMADWQLLILMQQTLRDLESVHKNTGRILSNTMETTIREGQEAAAIESMRVQVELTTLPNLCWTAAMPAVRASVQPNIIIDHEATETAREEARGDAEPAIFKSGQNIVVKGERVSLAQLTVLGSLGLLEGDRQDTMMLAGVAILGLIVIITLLFHIWQFEIKTTANLKSALILASIAMV
ncbi:MAG: hypothetical protein FWG37_04025, partial [Clostridia bacterium]|nr:hypothetical protein [Clostridia bacterium]